MVAEREGVIKFHLEYTPAPAVPPGRLRELNAWRRILFMLKLIGQDPARYDGLGFGNLSQRLPPFDTPSHLRAFLISGTQTGALEELGEAHYATVQECLPGENRVVASGPVRPSSESLTHGTLYGIDPGIRFVIHVHSPDLWSKARALGLPLTSEEVPYGTPEMAEEVCRLMEDPAARGGRIFAMGGHVDGIVSFGRSAEEAGSALLASLARAFELEN